VEVLHHLRARRTVSLRVRRRTLLVALTLAALDLGAPGLSSNHDLWAQRPAEASRGAAADIRWPVRTREHVDLWLHGFAMISDDSSQVPLFDRHYKATLTQAKSTAKVFSELDANHDLLAKRLQDNPALLNAQFLPLYFSTWADLENALELFVRAEGNPRNAKNDKDAAAIAFVANSFTGKEDRDFARRFLAGLRSERDLFFHEWWLAETKRRDRTFEMIDSLWQKEYRPKLQSYLNNTKLGNGELILALSLDAEGRTITEGKQQNRVAVGFPTARENAGDVLFAFAHEAVSSLTAASVDDNTTPAEKRSGAAAKLAGTANVRGGALLVAKVSPDLAPRYAAYYLRAAGIAPGSDVMATFARSFPLPAGMLESIERQIAIAFGGI
jgi:hypothetical protein